MAAAFVPRLADGRLGVVGRVHHAMADGAAALQIALLTLDIDGHDDAGHRRPGRPRRRRRPLQRALDPLVHSAELCTAPRATSPARWPTRAPPPATRCATPAGSSTRSRRTCCRTRRIGLNRPLGPRRTLVQHRVALDAVRAVSRGAPGTRNDVGLAAIAGALRALALEPAGRPSR